MTSALAIFVKTPGLSPLKTRLAAGIGRSSAETFHRLAAHAVGAVAQAAGSAFKPYWAVAESGALDHPLWRSLPTVWQGQGDLGARLDQVYAPLQRQYGRAVLIGADTPQITTALLLQAVQVLDDAAFVLGMSADGGFWLFGGRVPVDRQIWQSIAYSQADTADTLQSALLAHGEVVHLPTLVDLDSMEDLPQVRDALAGLTAPFPEQQKLSVWLRALPPRESA